MHYRNEHISSTEARLVYRCFASALYRDETYTIRNACVVAPPDAWVSVCAASKVVSVSPRDLVFRFFFFPPFVIFPPPDIAGSLYTRVCPLRLSGEGSALTTLSTGFPGGTRNSKGARHQRSGLFSASRRRCCSCIHAWVVRCSSRPLALSSTTVWPRASPLPTSRKPFESDETKGK